MSTITPAVGACALSQPDSDSLVIVTSTQGVCDPGQLRAGLQEAIVTSSAGASARQSGASQGGGYSNLQRTTSRPLFKLATAPSTPPPPTRFVMPGTR